MAGIGFELKKLFNRRGILGRVQAYGYTGVITSGPTIMGILYLLIMSFMARLAGLSDDGRAIAVTMITTALIASLFANSFVSMVVTRYTSDCIYENEYDRVLSSLYGALALVLPVSDVLWLIFLLCNHLSVLQTFLNFTLFNALQVVWLEMNYLSAVKDYKRLLKAYLFSIIISIASTFLLLLIMGASIEVLLAGVNIGYLCMMVIDTMILQRTFPKPDGRWFHWLYWAIQYPELIVIGVCSNIGLFAHLIIIWHSSIGVQALGLYYSSPKYDIPAMFAYLTIMITQIGFVASAEVNFYPAYRHYYDLFNSYGSITEIDAEQKHMLSILEREMSYIARRQLIVSALCLALGTAFLDLLPLGFDTLMNSYFRILCVGYGAYAVGNVLMLMQMYFADYKDAAKCALIYAVLVTGLGLLFLLLPVNMYGFPFAIASIIYYFACWYYLKAYVNRLPYPILEAQPLVKKENNGRLARWIDHLDQREEQNEAKQEKE